MWGAGKDGVVETEGCAKMRREVPVCIKESGNAVTSKSCGVGRDVLCKDKGKVGETGRGLSGTRVNCRGNTTSELRVKRRRKCQGLRRPPPKKSKRKPRQAQVSSDEVRRKTWLQRGSERKQPALQRVRGSAQGSGRPRKACPLGNNKRLVCAGSLGAANGQCGRRPWRFSHLACTWRESSGMSSSETGESKRKARGGSDSREKGSSSGDEDGKRQAKEQPRVSRRIIAWTPVDACAVWVRVRRGNGKVVAEHREGAPIRYEDAAATHGEGAPVGKGDAASTRGEIAPVGKVGVRRAHGQRQPLQIQGYEIAVAGVGECDRGEMQEKQRVDAQKNAYMHLKLGKGGERKVPLQQRKGGCNEKKYQRPRDQTYLQHGVTSSERESRRHPQLRGGCTLPGKGQKAKTWRQSKGNSSAQTGRKTSTGRKASAWRRKKRDAICTFDGFIGSRSNKSIALCAGFSRQPVGPAVSQEGEERRKEKETGTGSGGERRRERHCRLPVVSPRWLPPSPMSDVVAVRTATLVARHQGAIGLYQRGLVLCSAKEERVLSGPEGVRISTVHLLRGALLSLSRTERYEDRLPDWCQSCLLGRRLSRA
ncbi:hypothetical protein B0H17DRAFT_1133912 [Mycena rosella]|uniref:Uncharacterized protein n=1 Tax=Mycena rosella TaxID=1033263 RepID=A0AAD7GEG8_MYCRO|nr:hypothetical protein B0H17DRAFT_1133912 [Mycena rosella]